MISVDRYLKPCCKRFIYEHFTIVIKKYVYAELFIRIAWIINILMPACKQPRILDWMILSLDLSIKIL